jgi:hypothetical protein
MNANYLAALRPGKRVADIFEHAKDWYAAQGFSGEWERHHQGGGTGYKESEYVIGPDSEGVVLEHEAFAFTPMVQGAKVENMTTVPDWPAINVRVNDQSFCCLDILLHGAPQTEWEEQVVTADVG